MSVLLLAVSLTPSLADAQGTKITKTAGPRSAETIGISAPPLGQPRELTGVKLSVTFTIDSTGRVLGVQTDPRVADSTYAKRFDKYLRDYRFRPALDSSGKRVTGTYMLEITFGPPNFP